MLRRVRFAPLLFALAPIDDHAPLLDLHEDCDPLPPQDSEEPDLVHCICDVFSGGFAANEKCLDGDLFEFSLVPGERIAAGSFACDVDVCAFPGDPPPGFTGYGAEAGSIDLAVPIEIPLGVDVTSAAGALAAYNVPEPGAAGCAAIALATLLALRRR